MNILVTGGCGYTGTILIKKLLKLSHKVISIDTKWFGDFLPKHKNLKNIKFDIRELNKKKINLKNIHTIIHLSSIANDPMADLDKNLSWEISTLGTELLLKEAIKQNVKRIIYASSGSVYGIKKEKKVNEKLSLEPISIYNKVKMCTERVILSYKNNLETFIVRPGTVCGSSPRMRLDLTVNAMTYSAVKKGVIFVNGGSQIRPNIHIDDLTDLYIYLLNVNKKKSGIYNAGFENLSVLDIAKKISKITGAKIKIRKKNFDPRSYRLDSTKLKNIKFYPRKGIDEAILEVSNLFNDKKFKIRKNFYSIEWLKNEIVR